MSATPNLVKRRYNRAQREAELDALSADLLATVDETLKPEQVTLWLVRSQEVRR